MQAPGRFLPADVEANPRMATLTKTRRVHEPALDEIRRIFGLSEAELGDLFAVRRQSIEDWRRRGVPAARRATLEQIAGLARALERELIPTHIPEVVRTRDAWLSNKNILETIETGGVERVYGYLHRLFSYSGS
jgi:hypothetical protein